jgi:hypothetical protein
MSKKQTTEKSAAVVTIHRADEMTPEGRKEVAAWLRRQASFLTKDGDKLAKRFTARYLYT